MTPDDQGGNTTLIFKGSAETFMGMRNMVTASTGGNAVYTSEPDGFKPKSDTKAPPKARGKVMISSTEGPINANDLAKCNTRGKIVIDLYTITDVYEGQIIGELTGNAPQDMSQRLPQARWTHNEQSFGLVWLNDSRGVHELCRR